MEQQLRGPSLKWRMLVDGSHAKGSLSGGYGNTGCGVFKRGVQKLERLLPKNQQTQRKLLNFENWVSGEVSKIGHHFSK